MFIELWPIANKTPLILTPKIHILKKGTNTPKKNPTTSDYLVVSIPIDFPIMDIFQVES